MSENPMDAIEVTSCDPCPRCGAAVAGVSVHMFTEPLSGKLAVYRRLAPCDHTLPGGIRVIRGHCELRLPDDPLSG